MMSEIETVKDIVVGVMKDADYNEQDMQNMLQELGIE